MNRSEITSRVQTIFRDIFDDPQLVVGDDTNSSHIEEWDSLNHINLISAIEQDLKVKFALGELHTLQNVGEMITLIQAKKA